MRSNAYKCVTRESQVVPEASKGPEKQKCPFCDASFQPKRKWQKFCSAKCKVANWKKEDRLSAGVEAPGTLATADTMQTEVIQ